MEKVFTLSFVRDLEAKLNNEEISCSKFIELLNEKAQSKVDQWIRYANDLECWWILYKDDPTSMEASMNKPNKPGYYQANND